MGDVALSQGDFYNAIQHYKMIIDKDSSRLELSYNYAEACRLYFQYDEAMIMYDYIIRNDEKGKYPLSYIWMADISKTKGRYKKAKGYYEAFIAGYQVKTDFWYKKAVHEVEALDTSIILKEHEANYAISNLGLDVNTSYSELSPFYISDSALYFSSLRVSEGQIESNEELEKNNFKIFKAYKEDGVWLIDEGYQSNLNDEKYHIGNYVVRQDGKLAYFTRCKSASASSLQCAIYMADINDEGQFENIEKLPESVNAPGFNNTQLALAENSDNESCLIFASDRPGGYGQMDLWSADLNVSGRPKKARNLGASINSPGNELSPYFSKLNKRLYFSSDWHPGLGGLDVFETVYDTENEFYRHPKNVGRPINTPNDELFYILKDDSSGGFLATNREGAFFINEEHCCHDLYEVSFKEKEVFIPPSEEAPKLDTSQNMLVLEGRVLDFKTKRPLVSKLELVNNINSIMIEAINTNATDGAYMLFLPSGGDYGIAVSSPGYLFHSENFKIEASEGFEKVKKDILLKRIELGSSIVLKNIFFDFDQASLREESFTELNRLYELLINNTNLKIEVSGHTDNKGSKSYNKRLSLNRAKSVVQYLLDKGIDKKRMVSKGYGFDRPIATNETEEGRQLNRRTEFKIIGK